MQATAQQGWSECRPDFRFLFAFQWDSATGRAGCQDGEFTQIFRGFFGFSIGCMRLPAAPMGEENLFVIIQRFATSGAIV